MSGKISSGLYRLLISTVFWPSFALCTIFVATLIGLLRAFNVLTNASPNRTREHALICYWPVVIWLFNFWWLKITIQGHSNLPRPTEPVVMVANHESMFDIFVVYFLHVQFRWLSKKEMFAAPILGQCMRWADYVPVERGNPASHAEAMQTSAQWIRRGISMFFFPEGTRSSTSELRSFKAGAFRLAQEMQVPVLPLVISGTRNILPKGASFPRSSRVTIEILPQEQLQPGESPEAFAARIRDLVSAKRRL